MDRNRSPKAVVLFTMWSLSARRAWIEMSVSLTTSHVTVVALRKESVDRNQYLSGVLDFGPGSLSARRAWIEMGWRLTACPMMYVALRKESVDRNFRGTNTISYTIGRSPQGERG